MRDVSGSHDLATDFCRDLDELYLDIACTSIKGEDRTALEKYVKTKYVSVFQTQPIRRQVYIDGDIVVRDHYPLQRQDWMRKTITSWWKQKSNQLVVRPA